MTLLPADLGTSPVISQLSLREFTLSERSCYGVLCMTHDAVTDGCRLLNAGLACDGRSWSTA